MDITTTVSRIICEKLALSDVDLVANPITAETDIADLVDSLTLLDILAGVEEAFDLEITPNSELKTMSTVQSIVDYVNRKMNNSGHCEPAE